MRILITGALGHIGSRLIRELPSAFPRAEIVMLDDFSAQRYCSLFNLPAEGNYSFEEADVLTADLDAIFAGANVVVHLAAITNAAGSFDIREQVEQVNLVGTEKVARACLNAGCTLIFPSTTSVYGTQAEVVDEDCPVEDLKPQSPYADSKLRAEQLLADLGRTRGLRSSICRFGTIFGTSIGMRFHTAVNKFCWQAVMGQPLTIWRTALHQHRPYLDVGDAVEAIKFIIERELYDGRIYNVVTTNTSVSRIVELITSDLPDVTIEYVANEIMNQLSYHVLSDRFRGLGFEFTGSLERGIHDTISLLRQAQGRPILSASGAGSV
jgi:nucleoside-diphosphate-sugar epimerase